MNVRTLDKLPDGPLDLCKTQIWSCWILQLVPLMPWRALLVLRAFPSSALPFVDPPLLLPWRSGLCPPPSTQLLLLHRDRPSPPCLPESHPPETILSRHPFHRHYSLLHSVCQYHPYNTFITSYIKRICVSLRAKTKPCLSFCASFLFTLFSWEERVLSKWVWVDQSKCYIGWLASLAAHQILFQKF